MPFPESAGTPCDVQGRNGNEGGGNVRLHVRLRTGIPEPGGGGEMALHAGNARTSAGSIRFVSPCEKKTSNPCSFLVGWQK